MLWYDDQALLGSLHICLVTVVSGSGSLGMCLIIIGDSTSSRTGSSNGDLKPDEGVCGFNFVCGANGALMSSPNDLGGLSLMSLLCLSSFQGEGPCVIPGALFPRGRG